MPLGHLVLSTTWLTALTASTLQTLVYELASVDDWYSLGLNLGLGIHELRTIECNYLDSNRRKTEMLYLWLRNASHPTWEAVIDALCRMGYYTLALKIKREYISSTATVGMCLLSCKCRYVYTYLANNCNFGVIHCLPYLYRAVNMYLLCWKT